MKKKFLKFGVLLLATTLSVGFMTSCDDDDDDKTEVETDTNLTGTITGEKKLIKNTTYTLSGGFTVEAGGNLIIEEGVTVVAKDDNIVDYILVKQGGKITTNGTQTNPIVMTSESKAAGAWGGIHICGKAPINVTGGVGSSEIGNAPYGGTVANDNSGVLRYIRLEYTGYAFDEETESNGLTLYGVGNGTTIEYVQTYLGADDGFEWFGGTVNAKYLVSTGSGDDSFDWTYGWIGKGQFWVAVQNTVEGERAGDCLIEADNNGSNNALTPTSSPTIANLTLIGNADLEGQRGIRLRAGTHAKIYNAIVTGKSRSVTTETTLTEDSFKSGASVLEYVYATGTFVSTDATLALDTRTGNAASQAAPSLTSKYVGTITGGKDMSTVDSFFSAAAYKGAVQASNDWTAGWTRSL